jgi:dTDP-D-glucose 4,6-dehydratase
LRATVRWYAEQVDWWQATRDADFEDYYQRQYGWRLTNSTEA